MKEKKILIFFIFSLCFLLNKNLIAMPCNENEEIVSNQEKNSIISNSQKENTNIKENSKKQESKDKKEQTDIEISADKKIEVDKENGVMIATGNATVKEGLTMLKANMLTVFSCETKQGDIKLIQINADGNVIIKSDQGNAYAKRATYFVENKIIELYDNVKLEKDGDIIVGDKGKFNIFTGKGEISVVPSKKGSSKKVYGIIRSKKK